MGASAEASAAEQHHRHHPQPRVNLINLLHSNNPRNVTRLGLLEESLAGLNLRLDPHNHPEEALEALSKQLDPFNHPEEADLQVSDREDKPLQLQTRLQRPLHEQQYSRCLLLLKLLPLWAGKMNQTRWLRLHLPLPALHPNEGTDKGMLRETTTTEYKPLSQQTLSRSRRRGNSKTGPPAAPSLQKRQTTATIQLTSCAAVWKSNGDESQRQLHWHGKVSNGLKI